MKTEFRQNAVSIKRSFDKSGEATMDKEDAIEVMSHLAVKLADSVAIEDMVSAYAEFLAHINTSVTEEDFAFLATIGAMIYQKGFREYDSGVQTNQLMARLRQTA
jgi:NH3-dependent NAD+ synthetase